MTTEFKLAGNVDYVIDGSNVMLSNKLGGAPSVRAFALLLSLLDLHQKTFSVWFDESIYHHVREKGGDIGELRRLISELNAHRLLQIAPRADDGIIRECRLFGAAVINGGDNNDSWPMPVPPILRCRLNVLTQNEVSLYVAPAGGGAKLFTGSVSQAFQFRNLAYGPLDPSAGPPDIGVSWAAPPRFKGRGKPGALLVLVLDASTSMDEKDTYDGRSRADHVSDIVREALRGMGESKAGSNLMVALLSFSNEVAIVPANDDGYVFSPLQAWANAEMPDYLRYVPRAATNIRLALDKAADLIDGFRRSDVATRLALNWKQASVVMLTDGEHIAGSVNAPERSKDIIHHVFATLNRSEDVSFGFIGLGEAADHLSLHGWATVATDKQSIAAAQKGVPLESGRLYVKANTKDLQLKSLIRSFINVASNTVEP